MASRVLFVVNPETNEDMPAVLTAIAAVLHVCVRASARPVDTKSVTVLSMLVYAVLIPLLPILESAKECISKMNGRWFGGKQIIAELYDCAL